ncbi:MAG: GDP-mannose 4,6-dehydratase, partial [Deinococcus sp.]|nr:GDP-mannose 4,6-dehydratase [Deinococcus sp.]
MRHLVIGGAGFIGCNVADHFAARGDQVVVFDNFSRRGAFLNARWLLERHPRLQVESGDVRLDLAKLEHLVGVADVVYHLAAQVAVTTSVANPREDFEVNALGTFNVL